MEENLYFVNNIIEYYGQKIILNLFKVEENDYKYDIKKPVHSELFYISNEKLLELNIKEGSFVLYSKERGFIKKGNADKRAKKLLFINNINRGKLIKKYKEVGKKSEEKGEKVYSYHVNVGHGNCSIIVICRGGKCRIWIVDCGEHDFRNQTNYRNNIEDCFEFIKEKFRLNKIKIDRVLITHPHFDHISGLRYLIREHYLDGAEIWINFYYSWPGKKYNELLMDLQELKVKFIEPKVQNSTNTIEILYPNNTLLRSIPKNPQIYSNYSLSPKINNSSVIYKLNLGNKSMVFPGDIETCGWNQVLDCHNCFSEATFYCISHHGSINGHKRTRCGSGNSISDITSCFANKEINILMGRSNAFPGIFSQEVLSSFAGRLYRTDLGTRNREPIFLEVDWQENKVTYHPR